LHQNVAGELLTLQQETPKDPFYVALDLVSNVGLLVRQFDSTWHASYSATQARVNLADNA